MSFRTKKNKYINRKHINVHFFHFHIIISSINHHISFKFSFKIISFDLIEIYLHQFNSPVIKSIFISIINNLNECISVVQSELGTIGVVDWWNSICKDRLQLIISVNSISLHLINRLQPSSINHICKQHITASNPSGSSM